jgi:hypothetical protein
MLLASASMAEIRLGLREAEIAVESALASAERLSQHAIVQSLSFDILVEHLTEAQAALGRAKAAAEAEEAHVLQFPSQRADSA